MYYYASVAKPGCYYIFDTKPDSGNNQTDNAIINDNFCVFCTKDEIEWLDSLQKYWHNYSDHCKVYYRNDPQSKKSLKEIVTDKITKLGL
jgi:hypothetical protein